MYMKIPISNLGRACCIQKLFLTFRTTFVHNIFFLCSAKRRASVKDLPVPKWTIASLTYFFKYNGFPDHFWFVNWRFDRIFRHIWRISMYIFLFFFSAKLNSENCATNCEIIWIWSWNNLPVLWLSTWTMLIRNKWIWIPV